MRTLILRCRLARTNQQLHAQASDTNQTEWDIVNPRGAHAIAVRSGRPD